MLFYIVILVDTSETQIYKCELALLQI